MPIKYENVVPWGRSFDEYIDMFNLTDSELEGRILGCGDGPASFNYKMKLKGYKVISYDPVYQFTRVELEKRIKDTYKSVLDQTRNNLDKFIWERIKNLDHLLEIRMNAMKDFLSDYDEGKIQGRYIAGELPKLPFPDRSFDLILCAHFLLFYSENLTLDFHFRSIEEMLRVGKEIRIFPLLDLNSNLSAYYKPLTEYLDKKGIRYAEEKVNYEFQKNGNSMLKIFSPIN